MVVLNCVANWRAAGQRRKHCPTRDGSKTACSNRTIMYPMSRTTLRPVVTLSQKGVTRKQTVLVTSVTKSDTASLPRALRVHHRGCRQSARDAARDHQTVRKIRGLLHRHQPPGQERNENVIQR